MSFSLKLKLPLLEMSPQNLHEGRREEDEKDWIAAHPGFEFGVFDGRTLVSTHPSISQARRAAKSAIKPGTDIRVKDIHNPDRVYFREEEE